MWFTKANGKIVTTVAGLRRIELRIQHYIAGLDVSNNNLSGKISVVASSVKLIATPGNPFLESGSGSRNDGTGNKGNH